MSDLESDQAQPRVTDRARIRATARVRLRVTLRVVLRVRVGSMVSFEGRPTPCTRSARACLIRVKLKKHYTM